MNCQKILRKQIAVCLFTLFCSPIFAQNTENSLDELYVPSESSVFDEEGKSGGDGDISRDHKNIILFNPLLVLRSVGALHYQRNFGDYFSGYIGLGSAFGKDAVMQIGFLSGGELFDSDYEEYDISVIYDDGDLKSNLNLFFNAGVQFYYDSFWGFEYGYMGFDYRFINQTLEYVASYSTTSDNPYTGDTEYNNIAKKFDVDVRSHNMNFIFGTETSSSGKIGLYHAFYWGFGFRSTMYDEISNGPSEFTLGSTVQEGTQLTGNEHTRLSSTVLIGYKFGIGW
ncbi:MAG: hypothetical protein ACJAZ2_001228 [Glaciecola sp.]|jgi:hypothetical protein